jgi:hypothetical protein
MLWIIKSIINATIKAIETFELEISNDIWQYRYKKEMNKRKAFIPT